jgi:hypothetical protein
MKILLLICLMGFVLVTHAASPAFNNFNPSQFVTNGNIVAYDAVLTNQGGLIGPAQANTLFTVTNQNVYGTWSTPSKVTLLSLGTNQLDMTLQSAWLLNSPTNDPTQVILSLSAGAYQGQHAFLLSQNGDEGFTLPNYSEQYNVPGAYVILGQTNTSNWIGSTNRGIHLVYSAPDWVIEGLPTDPSVPGGGSTNITATVGPGTVNTLAVFGPTTTSVSNSMVIQTGSGSGITFQPFGTTNQLALTFSGGAPKLANNTLSTSITIDGVDGVALGRNGSPVWYSGLGGTAFIAANDNTQDIGLSANNRPRTVYSGTSFITAGTLKTGDPGSGSGVWKLGKKLSGSVLTLTTNYYEVMVDGVLGAIPIVTVTP